MRWTVIAAVFASALAGAAMAERSVQLMNFDDLFGWAADDHAAALRAFQETCPDFDDPQWRTLCDVAATNQSPRDFFEMFFKPVMVTAEAPALFTGYFEPELDGALQPSARFRYPLYRMPAEARNQPWHSRREIEQGNLLANRGLEIAWVDDPVELFFLQIQGSGRVRLPDGSMIRVGYGGKNGHNYSSVGAELVRRGIYESHQVSARVIQTWVRNNPTAGRELLWTNDSYVFFREVSDVPAHRGPLGAMNRSITTLRSVAVDPDFVPLGAPVWIEKEGANPLRQLMIAQDTGSAIKGAQRADIFYGTGDQAGRDAGRVRDGGRMIVLLPIQHAYAMAPAGTQ